MRSMLDRLLAAILLLALSPVILFTAGLILILDGSPIFFSQSRLGLNRQPFTLLKFRTMRDGKMIGIGKYLRRTGIDEIPQIFNVLAGYMSFVGPRPLTQADTSRLGWDGPTYDIRWTILPGITGPAQLLTICDSEIYFQLDCRYVRQRSLIYDLTILISTLRAVLSGKKSGK